MKQYRFQSTISDTGTIDVPDNIAGQIGHERPVGIVLLVAEESEDDRDWRRLTAEQFLNGYADSDAIYDELSSG